MIPTSFDIMGRTVTVHIRPSEYFHDDDTLALWDMWTHTISIRETLPEAAREQAFYHEFMHAAFEVLGHSKLSRDEALVDSIGSLILQMLRTRDIL